MSTKEIASEKDQYTLWQIFGIWLAAGGPMWLLGWVAYPVLSADLPPTDAGLMRIKLLTVGLLPKMEGVFGKWDWVANGDIAQGIPLGASLQR